MPVNPNDGMMNPFKSIKHDFTRYVHVKNCDLEISASVAKRILESLPGVESVRFMFDEELGVWYRAYVIFEDKLSAENAVNCLNLRVLGKQMFSADNVHDRLLHTWKIESTIFTDSYEYVFYGAVVVDNLHNSEVNLYDMFSKYGSIIFIYVIQSPGDGTRLRTLVVYSTLVEAVAAVIAMHNTKIVGRTIYARLLLTEKDYDILSMSENSDTPINVKENYLSSDWDIETNYRVHNECHALTYRSDHYKLETELNSDYENDREVEKILKINGWSKEMETDIELKAESNGVEINASECKEYEITTENNFVLNSLVDVQPIEIDQAQEAKDCFSSEDVIMKSDYDIKEKNNVCGDVKDEKMEVVEVAVIVKSCSSVENIDENHNPTSNSRLKRNSYTSGWNNRRNNEREKQDCKSSSVSNGNDENRKKRRQGLENTHPKREAVVKEQQNPQGWKQVRRNSSHNRWNRKRNNSEDQFFEYRNDPENHFVRGNYLQKLRAEAVRGKWNQRKVFYNHDKRKSGMGKLKQPLSEERLKDCSLISVSAPNVKFMVTDLKSESNNVAYHGSVVKSVSNHSTVTNGVANHCIVTKSISNHCTVMNSVANQGTDENSIENQISNADVKISITCSAENTQGILNTTPTRGTYAEALARTGVSYTNSVTKSIVTVEWKDSGTVPIESKRGK